MDYVSGLGELRFINSDDILSLDLIFEGVGEYCGFVVLGYIDLNDRHYGLLTDKEVF